MNLTNATLIRLGLLSFPIAGFIGALSALTPGIGINPARDPAGFAQAASLIGLANLAGLIAFVFLLYGFQALYAFLANTSVQRWALAGMVWSIAGAALFASFLGIFAFAPPAAARSYINGQEQAISIISDATSISNPSAFAFGRASVISYVLGSIFFSLAIWRSNMLPRWSAVAYAISAPLNVVPHYMPALWFAGGMLLLGAGLGIVRAVWKSAE